MHIIGGAEKGGSRTHLITLAKELLNNRDFDAEVELVCFIDGVVAEEARANHIPVTVFPMNKIYDLRVISQLSRHINQCRPQIIHTHGFRANFIGRLANLNVNVGNDIPLVTTVHSSMAYDYANKNKGRFYRFLDRLTRSLTDHYIVVSDALKTELIADGIAPDKITRIYNSLAYDFPRGEQPAQTIRKELDIPAETPLLTTVGRLESVKNQQMLLEIFSLLKQENINFHGLIAGSGSLEQQLAEQAVELNVADRVSFLGFRDDVYYLLKQSDIFLLTSTMEGFGITLLEAMATATPVIVTDVGGMHEIVNLARNGFVVPINDNVQFVARIEEILKSPDLSKKLADNGSKALNQHFTPEIFAANTYQLYQAILNNARKKRRKVVANQ